MNNLSRWELKPTKAMTKSITWWCTEVVDLVDANHTQLSIHSFRCDTENTVMWIVIIRYFEKIDIDGIAKHLLRYDTHNADRSNRYESIGCDAIYAIAILWLDYYHKHIYPYRTSNNATCLVIELRSHRRYDAIIWDLCLRN